jgi:class 3 adenylate cyclase
MSHRNYVDQRVKQGALTQPELELLSEEIAASARATVVVFIDLTDSTLMKYQRPAKDWIGSVYEFIKRCDFLAQQRGGTIVKHIGDEVMITFPEIDASEVFLPCMLGDETLGRYRFKTAVDFGDAYFLHSHHYNAFPTPFCPWPAPHDPYGKVVDRCARIAALAPCGSVLCSEDYKVAMMSDTELPLAGVYTLKGIPEPCRIYFRHPPAAMDAVECVASA